MPAYHVKRSIIINKPIAEVHQLLSHFDSWPSWSPWLIMEPECPVSYGGTQGELGANYHWSGDMVGEGKMSLVGKTDTTLECDLEFIRPFKSLAQANFYLADKGAKTEVTWTLDAKLPWFMFFLKNMMQTMLGMDYERGLKMLKALLEEGRIDSKLKMIGERQQETLHYISLGGEATIDKLKEIIPQDYNKLAEYFQANNIDSAGAPFTLYFDMDMKTSVNTIRNCFPVKQAIDVPAPFICDKIDKCTTYAIEHIGPYHFVGNGWSYAMFSARHKKVKTKKSPVGFERYLNDPFETQPEDLITEIVLFKK